MEVRSEQPFSVRFQKSSLAAQASLSGMRLTVTPDGTAVYKPITTTATSTMTAAAISSSPAACFHGGSVHTGAGTIDGSAGNGSSVAPATTIHGLSVGTGEPLKNKRGRPREYYWPDGSTTLALTTASPTSMASPGTAGLSPLSAGQTSTGHSFPCDPMKKARGRPRGSGKKMQMLALGSAGIGFTAHVITVRAGEDVSSKIMSFSQHGPHTVCILSAIGAISNVTLRQAAASGGTVTYEGRFEILSLSGSFLLSESDGQRSRTGGLSISLAGPDGRVLGGGVAGLLTAASPVQVVVGSFIADDKKEPRHTNTVSTPGELAPGSGGGGLSASRRSPPSRGTLSESSGEPSSPLNISSGTCNNSQLGMLSFLWK